MKKKIFFLLISWCFSLAFELFSSLEIGDWFTNDEIREHEGGIVSLKVKAKVTQSCPTLCDPMDFPYSPWNSPGQDSGVGRLSLLQGIFPTQGSNPGLLHCSWILYQLSYTVSLGFSYLPLPTESMNQTIFSFSMFPVFFD